MKKKVAFHNLGCKVNAYEAEAMQQQLREAGYEIVPFGDPADVCVVNTCSVTNVADKKSRQMIHRARKQNPEAVIVAAGCYVQAAGEKMLEDLSVDLIIGNNRKKELAAILDGWFADKKRMAYLADISHAGEYEDLTLTKTDEHTRAYIKVQDGCNQFCTYCIIPYTRGRVRSRRPEDVIREVEGLVRQGYQEFVLTGIHLSSYGVDLGEAASACLLDLIRQISRIEGVRRIRLGSLEPGIITEPFAVALKEIPAVCPHFHLSLQSGCDATLKRMNRRYTAEEYAEKCTLLRKTYEEPALTTDVIVGFPGETEEEFARCREFLEKISFYETHIFKYSRRRGTRAAAMPGQIPEAVKTARSQVLQALCGENRANYVRRFIGRRLEVLFEETVQVDGRIWWNGYSREYIRVLYQSDEELSNRIRTVYGKELLDGEYLAASDY
ncbi:MAG TPA: tRNA (N(6)-L-threonylcarbamoyladenosine(37)-C(2))-methylthiotransferase MtaB [Lachnospiraceae bacterium]|nr:tRNA (N(6)-L-threonylcarbamoyladenosine(37)-C(2))-methylthiotransferase MtaB [Lachnospiraceae bacterium]